MSMKFLKYQSPRNTKVTLDEPMIRADCASNKCRKLHGRTNKDQNRDLTAPPSSLKKAQVFLSAALTALLLVTKTTINVSSANKSKKSNADNRQRNKSN
jgi:hypothetical protein